ncbi:hypothetical protein HL657_11155 [Methanoculleus sp. YWC-01]|uniref:SDR family oxidoreductase n=1 Tax=Methanoculleus nereidis TaxID=2735141 RepID=A0ABU3Z4H2_9EURY|nr:hypothetical protein [Methanoculleus sp. YWC-01]
MNKVGICKGSLSAKHSVCYHETEKQGCHRHQSELRAGYGDHPVPCKGGRQGHCHCTTERETAERDRRDHCRRRDGDRCHVHPGMELALAGVGANPRMGRPDEIASPALFLTSDGARFVNGVVVAADAGWAA